MNYPRAPKVCPCHPPPSPPNQEKPFLFATPNLPISERYAIQTMLDFMKQEVNINPPQEFLDSAPSKEQIYVKSILLLFHAFECCSSTCHNIHELRQNSQYQDDMVYLVFQYLKNPNSPKYPIEKIHSADTMPYEIRHFLHTLTNCFLNHLKLEV